MHFRGIYQNEFLFEPLSITMVGLFIGMNGNGIILELGELRWRFVYRIRSATSAVLQQSVDRYVINTYSADTLLVLMTGAASWAVTVAEWGQ